MKLIATVLDGNAYYHMGLDIEAHSVIIEIPEDKLPKLVKDYYSSLEHAKKYEQPFLTTLRFSILDE